MKIFSSLILSSVLGVSLVAAPSLVKAQSTIPETQETAVTSTQTAGLFVNLTTNDPWRSGMAINFAHESLKRGHPVTIFLNITAVNLASTTIPQHTNGMTGKTLQQMLQELIASGGTVIICPSCMKQSGISEAELIEGVQMGSPEITQQQLFAENVRVLSW